jgi:glycosyltransferase involved in cell wall biosynthesis
MESVKKSARISAVVPIKNGEKFLSKFLPQVIKNLDYSDEIVIVNDRSTDRTESIVKEWASKYLQIRLINNTESGLVSALNLGIRESSFDWIARFDVDDSYSDDRLKKQRELISSETVAIFSDYEIMGSGKFPLGTIHSPISPLACSLSLISSQRTAHPSSIFNKNAFKFVGGYRKGDFLVEDLSLWLRLSRIGDLVSIPQSLLKYNLNRNSVSMQNREEMKKNKKKVMSEIGISPDHLKQIENFEVSVSLYEGVPDPHIRTLLLAKEIILNLKESRKHISWRSRRSLTRELIRNPYRFGIATTEITGGKILRGFFRHLPKN